MSARKLTDEQIDAACELRETKGHSTRVIIGKLGLKCSEGALNWHFLTRGAESPKVKAFRHIYRDAGTTIQRGDHKVRRFTREEDAKLLALERRGATPTQMGRALGRKHNSVVGRLATLARHQERNLTLLNHAA